MSSPKLALVTGASGGIGRITSLALAKEGYSIAVHYNTDITAATDLVSTITAQYPNVKSAIFQADLSFYDSTRDLHAKVVTEMGTHVSVLFNNAGLTMGKSGVKDISEVTVEEFEGAWRANCGTGFLLTQLCIPAMLQAGWGRVVFCSSVAGFTGGGVGPHYASSKSALHGLIHWLATAYAKRGITVNGVAPALIEDTKMLDSAVVDRLKDSKRLLKLHPNRVLILLRRNSGRPVGPPRRSRRYCRVAGQRPDT